jgi:hypothetical protein
MLTKTRILVILLITCQIVSISADKEDEEGTVARWVRTGTDLVKDNAPIAAGVIMAAIFLL